ncbi:MAG: TRAP transporter substrate-binding protein [bacterium]
MVKPATVIRVIVFILVLAAAAWYSLPHGGENRLLRACDDHPPGYPTTEGLYYMAERVKELSDGKILMQVYPSAQLGSEKETLENTRMGVIDINRVSCAPISEFMEEMGVFSMPYIFRDEEHEWKVLDGEIGSRLAAKLTDVGMIGIAYYDSGARSFYNTSKPINSPANLKGLKIRTQKSKIMIDLVEALGASATPMAFEEVYSALQTGVIDGAENNPPSYDSTGHYEVAKYYSLDEHSRIPEIVVISKITWDRFTDEERDIISRAAKESEEVQKRLWKEYEEKSMKKVAAAGCKINRPDKTAFLEGARPVYEKYGRRFGDLIREIQAVR